MKYLHSKQHYTDRYDLHTIEECLDWYWKMHKGMEKHRDEVEKKEPGSDFDKEAHKACSLLVNSIKGERYRRRAETIQKWFDRDKTLQDKYDQTQPPKNVVCAECQSSVVVIDKNMHDSYGKKPKMSFMFECTQCESRQIKYEDGSEWDYKPDRCVDCDVELETKYESDDDKDITITTTFCPECDFKKVELSDHKKWEKEQAEKKKRDKDLLKKYRKEFCLDDTNGPDYLRTMDGLARLVEDFKKQEAKEKDPSYQKAKKLKKLKLNQLKDLLVKALEEVGYVDLRFGKPDIGRYVIVDFTMTDTNDDRSEYDSRNVLRKLIQNTLKNTTWRLMSDGVSCRLGILSGRLKAYEREDELVKLID